MDGRCEPNPYIEYDSPQNIIESIRLNAAYNDDLIYDCDLSGFVQAKEKEEAAVSERKTEQQKMIEIAKSNNVCRFHSPDGHTASFAKNGRFLVRPPKGALS